MENSKSFLWPQGILIALLGLSAILSLGLMLLIRPNSSEAGSRTDISKNNVISVESGTKRRIETLKLTMLTSWQQQAQIKGLTYAIPKRFQGTTIKSAKLVGNKKVIALTFDDGPWPETTSQVLDILQANNVKATFFVVGRNVKNYPHLVRRVITDGHAIGNHTWHHWYHYINSYVAASEVDHTNKLIYQMTGVKTNLFRPPGGIMHNGVAAYAKNSNYAIIMWSSDSLDYSTPTSSRLVENVFKHARPGGIVLLHDGGGNRSQTVKALPEIIHRFRTQGYGFVTVPELLELEETNLKS